MSLERERHAFSPVPLSPGGCSLTNGATGLTHENDFSRAAHRLDSCKRLGPLTCTLTKIDDESGKSQTQNVPVVALGDDARFELTLDGVKFRASANQREAASVHFTAWLAGDNQVSADGPRGLTMLTVTTKASETVQHYDFRCKP